MMRHHSGPCPYEHVFKASLVACLALWVDPEVTQLRVLVLRLAGDDPSGGLPTACVLMSLPVADRPLGFLLQLNSYSDLLLNRAPLSRL